MALAVIQEQNLTDIADAIRSKNGTSDTYLPSQMAQAITDIPTGGGQDSGGKYLVQVIDYDGTVLKQDHLNSGATFTMPDQPSHSRLVFQEWSTPVTITNGEVTVGNSDIIIGAVYTTASGLSEFDIELTPVTGLSVTFNMGSGSSVNVDWGDGSLTNDGTTTHTYASYGKYTIKCNRSTLAQNMFGQSSSAFNYTLVRAFLANITEVEIYAFTYCYSLAYVTLPTGVTQLGVASFQNCAVLDHLILPSSCTYIANWGMRSCTVLSKLVLPTGFESFGTNALQGSYGLCFISLPNTVSTINQSAFQECLGLQRITFKRILPLYNNIFLSCRRIVEYDFSSLTNVPTLSNTNSFSGISPLCKIIVPDALYDTWIATTNWVTYANYIYKASEV